MLMLSALLLAMSLLSSQLAGIASADPPAGMEPNTKVVVSRTYPPGAIAYATIFDRNFNRADEVIEKIDLTQMVNGDPIVEVRIVQPTEDMITLSAVDGTLRDRNSRPVTAAVESGPNTSEFEFEFQIPDDIEVNSSVTVLYNDPFEITPQAKFPEKQPVTLTDVRFADHTGKPLREIAAGDEVIIGSIIRSHTSSTLPYAYIVQVKDTAGFTVFLSAISGNLEPQRAADAKILWIPDEAGAYTVEIFVWDNLISPAPLLAPTERGMVVS